MIESYTQQIYNKYIGKVTCAYKEDVFTDRNGVAFVGAKRTKERDKYIFRGFGEKMPVLIECPLDVLTLEFEGTRIINKEIVKDTERRLIRHGLDYCIADHGGTSPYIYLWNLKALPQGFEKEAKKHIAHKIVPIKYHSLLDPSNLGKTLIPIIDAPHWKPKYQGAVHKIIAGKHPQLHNNRIHALLDDFTLPKPKNTIENDPICKHIKASVRLSDVLARYGMDISRNPTKCLWHDSKSGRCFRFNDRDGLWKCWHCDRAGNLFHFIMEQEGCDFPEAKRRAAKIAGLQAERASQQHQDWADLSFK